MSANDYRHDWLKQERTLIKNAIQNKIPVFGICLGAQQISKALGGEVFVGKDKEVGWHQVSTKLELTFLPKDFTAFHWHQDQFTIPNNSSQLFSNQVCPNQGFLYDDHVIGLQFHFESTTDSVNQLIENDEDYLDNTTYVQDKEEIKSFPIPKENKHILFALLDYIIYSVI